MLENLTTVELKTRAIMFGAFCKVAKKHYKTEIAYLNNVLVKKGLGRLVIEI